MALLIVPHMLVSWGFHNEHWCGVSSALPPPDRLWAHPIPFPVHTVGSSPVSKFRVRIPKIPVFGIWHHVQCNLNTVLLGYTNIFTCPAKSPILSAEISLNVYMCSYPIPPLHNEHWHTAAIIWKQGRKKYNFVLPFVSYTSYVVYCGVI